MIEFATTAAWGIICAWVATLLAWVWSDMVVTEKGPNGVYSSQGD